MDGYVTMGDVFATLDEIRSSAMPAFLEQGLTPQSELVDPTGFIVSEQRFSPEKTSLEEEQKQDLWLAVGRDYKIKPGGSTFQRWYGDVRSEPSERETTPPEAVEPREAAPKTRRLRRARTPSEIIRRTGLGQLPEEIASSVDTPGVTVAPVARISPEPEDAPLPVPEAVPGVEVPVKKSVPWLAIGGVVGALLAGRLLLAKP